MVDAATSEVLFTQSGPDNETMKRAVVDLSKHLNKSVFLRLVDKGAEGWGHINFDDFRMHDTEPKIAASERLVKLDVVQFNSLQPQQVADAMTLPEGFSVQVIAAEPEVQQPVAMTIDEKGRIWVVEAYEYPQRAKGDKGRDRILILEDTDKNGSLDSRKVFYEGLNLASGIEVGFGGVFLSARHHTCISFRIAIMTMFQMVNRKSSWMDGLIKIHMKYSTHSFGGPMVGFMVVMECSHIPTSGDQELQMINVNRSTQAFGDIILLRKRSKSSLMVRAIPGALTLILKDSAF